MLAGAIATTRPGAGSSSLNNGRRKTILSPQAQQHQARRRGSVSHGGTGSPKSPCPSGPPPSGQTTGQYFARVQSLRSVPGDGLTPSGDDDGSAHSNHSSGSNSQAGSSRAKEHETPEIDSPVLVTRDAGITLTAAPRGAPEKLQPIGSERKLQAVVRAGGTGRSGNPGNGNGKGGGAGGAGSGSRARDAGGAGASSGASSGAGPGAGAGAGSSKSANEGAGAEAGPNGRGSGHQAPPSESTNRASRKGSGFHARVEAGKKRGSVHGKTPPVPSRKLQSSPTAEGASGG